MIINGQSGAIEQPQKSEFDPQSGWKTIRTFHCIGSAALISKINELIFQGYSLSTEEKFNAQTGSLAYTVVQATIANSLIVGGGEQPQDNYELSVNKVQKDLLDADHSLVNLLNEDNRDQLRKYLADPSAYENQFGFSGEASTGADLDSFNAATYLWKLVQAGVRHIEVRQPVLRLNRYVSQAYNTFFAFQAVGKILTTASVKTSSGVPPTFLIKLDQITAAYTNPNRKDGLIVQYGWLKEAPTLSQSYASKLQIQQEYVFGLWDTGLYGYPI